MTNGGYKRRACDKEEQKSLVDCYEGIRAQLTEMNSTQKKHGGWFKEIFKRVKKIENDEIREEGVREGKTMLKTSTRNMIIVVIMATGLYIAGVREIRSQKQQTIKILKAQVVQDKDTEKDYIKQRFKGIEDKLLSILTHSMKGGAK